MRVSLLYNRRAGSPVPLGHIRDAIAQHGHRLVCVVEAHADVERLLQHDPDVVVAAGGDGTVASAARTLAGRGIPLAILPLGTANNIARSLAIQGSIEDLVAAWQTARRVPLDLGIVEIAGGRLHFVEGIGAGLIPAALDDMHTRSDGDELAPAAKLTGATGVIGRVLSQLSPIDMTIVADGARTSGAFLLVEVLNIRSIGPNLVFSVDATPSDGLFHVVMAGEEHRDELARYLQEVLVRPDAALVLPTTRARHVTLLGASAIHLDDEVVPMSPQGLLTMQIEAGELDVLV